MVRWARLGRCLPFIKCRWEVQPSWSRAFVSILVWGLRCLRCTFSFLAEGFTLPLEEITDWWGAAATGSSAGLCEVEVGDDATVTI